MDSNYWNSRYRNDDVPWDASAITTPIKEYIDQLTNKSLRILIPGCGHAHEAEYLFRQGFTAVYVCDWAEQSLLNFSERVPDFPKDQLLCTDFFAIDQKFDLVIEQTFFCTLEQLEQRKAYARKVRDLLSEGGKLVGLFFEMEKADGPPFGGNREQYQAIFEGLFSDVSFESAYNSIKPRAGKELFGMCRV